MKTISAKVNFLSRFSFTNIHFSQYSRGRISTCWTMTADSSPLHKASDWTQTLGFQAEFANDKAMCPKKEGKNRVGNECKRKRKECGKWRMEWK